MLTTSKRLKGFTLVELMVALGLFAVVMTIASGAYLILINATRDAQAITTGINNLSFALDSMSRSINTGSAYNCVNGNTFTFTDQYKNSVTYNLSGPRLYKTEIVNGTAIGPTPVTDPLVVITSSPMFYCAGTASLYDTGDKTQAHVTVVVEGHVEYGPQPQKKEYFNIQTGSTMRGTDL